MQKHRRVDNKGFTIIEVLVASVIFGIASLGVYMTMAGIQKPVLKSDRSLKGTYFAQQVLEKLRGEVNARTIDTGCLALGVHPNPNDSCEIPLTDGINTITYTVTCADNSNPCTAARQVILNVAWVNPS